MYLKWIVCDVEKEKVNAFSQAQEKWIKMKTADGLIAQLGGWNVNKRFEACILSFWEQKKYLEKFMAMQHDQLFEHNKQQETYNSIQVQYFRVINKIEKEVLNELIKNNTKISVFDYLKGPTFGEPELKQTKNNVLGINEYNNSKILDVYFSNNPRIKNRKAEIKQIQLKKSWEVLC